MITEQTLLILGAGASQPYGFPTGPGLRNIICRDLSTGESGLSRTLMELGYKMADIKTFRDTFWLSQKSSIDAFLEHRTGFLKIGKAAISAALIPCEQEEPLFSSGDWYQHLFYSMNASFDDFDKNKLAILTYNYDRSIEHYLFTALKNAYGKKDEECINKVLSIPIIHLHGQLGPLWPIDQKGRPYQTALGAENMNMAIDGIKIIHEDISKEKQFETAFTLISKAQRICFLGFGYDKINLQRLFNCPDWKGNASLWGTAFQLTDAEKHRIASQFQGRLHLGYATHRNLEYLKEIAFLWP